MEASSYDPENPRLVPSIVCVADVLGYKEMVLAAEARGESNQLLRQLKQALGEAYARLAEHAHAWDDETFFKTKTFTDNVVVGCPLSFPDGDGESETAIVLMAFAEHQARLAAAGFFLRGGIAFGRLYMDESVVFGPALLEAHELDVKGGAPRLRLAKSQLELVRSHLAYYGGWAPHFAHLLKDADGEIFLNYLSVAFEDFPDAEIDRNLLGEHRDRISEQLADLALDAPTLGRGGGLDEIETETPGPSRSVSSLNSSSPVDINP